ncbi:MAG: hypothetical protein Q8N18_11810 [Opitutaceae bacterium]|nr:hypothetical protein [Opitutaceae bacterium]
MDGDAFRCVAHHGTSPDAVSSEARLSVGSARLANLSVLTRAGTGAQTLTLGFVLTSSGSKSMLIRGVGPSLSGQKERPKGATCELLTGR